MSCDFEDAYQRLLDHHTDTVRNLAIELNDAKREANEARTLRQDRDRMQAQYEWQLGEVKRLKAELELPEKLCRHLHTKLGDEKYDALVKAAELDDEIPF